MRPQIVPGEPIPDFELADHTGTLRRLSHIQGGDPMILCLARGAYCPQEYQHHLELAGFHPKIAVAFTRVATITPDTPRKAQEFRDAVGARWPFLADPDRTVQRDLGIVDHTHPDDNPMIPYTLVLKPGLIVHSIYDGYWFWGRPSTCDLWHDLREVTREIRPDARAAPSRDNTVPQPRPTRVTPLAPAQAWGPDWLADQL